MDTVGLPLPDGPVDAISSHAPVLNCKHTSVRVEHCACCHLALVAVTLGYCTKGMHIPDMHENNSPLL